MEITFAPNNCSAGTRQLWRGRTHRDPLDGG
jgi:hypothetical protein